jgi:plasmid stabilization system protein ParE
VSLPVTFSDEAVRDLQNLFDFLAPAAGEAVARSYIERLFEYCRDCGLFPERGTRRDDLRPGLRLLGYRRRATIALAVLEDRVVILRVLHRGRDVETLVADDVTVPR